MDSDDLSSVTSYIAEINSKPVQTMKTDKYKVTICQINRNRKWIKISEKAVLYFVGNNIAKLNYGDKILIRGNFNYINKQTNPYAFDYAKYMQKRGFYFNDCVNPGEFMMVRNDHSVKYLGLMAGDYFERILSTYISVPREADMVKAMMLGRRDEITPEMEYVYNSQGLSYTGSFWSSCWNYIFNFFQCFQIFKK